jgi:MFS family permease
MNDVFRLRACAVALVVAPALPLACHLLQTTPATHDTAAELASIAEHPTAASVAGALGFLAVVLFVPAAFGLAAPLWGPRPRVATVGLSMSVAGALGYAALLGSGPLTMAMVDPAADRAQMIALTDRYESSALMAVWLVLMILGYTIGPIVLGVGLWRAGWSWGVPVLLLAGLALFVLDAGRWPLAAGFACTWAGMALAGATLWRLAPRAVERAVPVAAAPVVP